MRYLVVIPARGGSKGIPKKNIYPVAGKPLLEYSLDLMQDVAFEGDVVVSTDSEEIAAVAGKYESVTVIKRPEEISGDTASTEAALIHALHTMEECGKVYDAVVTLQATSPLRTPQTVMAAFAKYEESRGEYDALLTLSETRADYWVMEEEGHYHRLYPNAPRRRQERKPMYVENSALYITDRQALLDTNLVLGHAVNGFVIPEIEGVDINEPIDILIAEQLLLKRKESC